MQSQRAIEIYRPIDEVFEFTNDHVTEWSLTVVEDEVIEEKPEGVGTTFRIVTEEKGRRMDFQGVVTGYERPLFSRIMLTGEHFDIDAEYRFEDLSNRTRVTATSTIYGKGFVKVMFFLFGWLMKIVGRKAMNAELENLKKVLESRAEGATSSGASSSGASSSGASAAADSA